MKLYSIQASNNCRRVNATIHHLDIDVERVDLAGFAALKTPEYLALNPNGKVPLLIDGDLTLWESRSIMQYLVASQRPGHALWPNDLKRQADIARWQFWESSHLSRGTAPYAFENLFKKLFMKQAPDPMVLAAADKEWHTFAPILDRQLASGNWVLGAELTLADFSVGGSLSFAEASALPMERYENIRGWWKRLGDVPAWKATAPRFDA